MDAVDLFCGCGGMSLGFQNAGYVIKAAFDNWDAAIKVYSDNFNHPIYKEDLTNYESISKIQQFSPDIIIGGPPCQDFSSAGKRDESLGRAQLSESYCRMIIAIKPKFFVMENVPTISKSSIYNKIVNTFRQNGYGLTEKVLDASYCGVPQARKRLFLIGGYLEKDDFLREELESHLSKQPMTMRDYFGDSLGTEYYFRIPRSYSRRAIFSIDEPSMTIRGVERPIPPNYKKHPNDPVDIGPQVRSLTPIERSYVQTFPKSFVFSGSKTDMNMMIGNAVPVKLAQYVAEAILRYTSKTRHTE